MQKILTLSSAKHFGLTSGEIVMGRFPGGEVSLTVKETLEGADVFVIGSTNAPAENLVEMLLTLDTVEKHGAGSVTAVIPYFAYSRAMKEKFPGESVSAQTIAKLIDSVAGKNFKVISLDIHDESIAGFFKSPFENVLTTDIFAEKLKDFGDFTIVAPDRGAGERANEFAKKTGNNNVAVLQKERAEDRSISITGIEGKVGRKVLLIDDIVDSGGTILKGAEFLFKKGVKEIHLAVTHMVWQGEGYKLLSDSSLITKIYTTNTIVPPAQVPEKIEIISVSPLLQKAMGVVI